MTQNLFTSNQDVISMRIWGFQNTYAFVLCVSPQSTQLNDDHYKLINLNSAAALEKMDQQLQGAYFLDENFRQFPISEFNY